MLASPGASIHGQTASIRAVAHGRTTKRRLKSGWGTEREDRRAPPPDSFRPPLLGHVGGQDVGAVDFVSAGQDFAFRGRRCRRPRGRPGRRREAVVRCARRLPRRTASPQTPFNSRFKIGRRRAQGLFTLWNWFARANPVRSNQDAPFPGRAVGVEAWPRVRRRERALRALPWMLCETAFSYRSSFLSLPADLPRWDAGRVLERR